VVTIIIHFERKKKMENRRRAVCVCDFYKIRELGRRFGTELEAQQIEQRAESVTRSAFALTIRSSGRAMPETFKRGLCQELRRKAVIRIGSLTLPL